MKRTLLAICLSASCLFVAHPIRVHASSVPDAPVLFIPAYPDLSAWHNDRSPAVVSWGLPENVTEVAALLDQNAGSEPTDSDGRVDRETLRVPEDGVWYLHVRFGNSAGWGETAHARIAVDTVAPKSFEIVADPAFVTDEPAPTLSFETEDDLSGMAFYEIRVDGGEPTRTKGTSFALADLVPGRHAIAVDAVDLAGNRASASAEIRILPIASPTIGPVVAGAYAGEGGLETGGTAEMGTRVVVELRRQDGDLIGTSIVGADERGHWIARFDQPLATGDYAVSATAMDARGARSIPARAAFSVTERPYVSVRGIPVSKWLFNGIVLLLVALGFGAGWALRAVQKKRRGWYADIARKDAETAFDQIQEDTAALAVCGTAKKISVHDLEVTAKANKRLRQRLRRFRQYVLDSIRDKDD